MTSLIKERIGTNPPSKYMNRFIRINREHIEETMRTHLIGDFGDFGIMDDNYDKFISERAKMVSKELKKRIIEREIDRIMERGLQIQEQNLIRQDFQD